MKGTVKRVIDGDTIEVAVRVRLNRIDAPETRGKERELGLVAKDWLAERLHGKEVDLGFYGTDYYGRALCDVVADGRNVTEDMLRAGQAEVYASDKHNDGKIEKYV